MRDDIDSWSRPRLAERLKVVGLRAHVAGDARPQQTRRGDDARPQQTRRGDDDGEEHHGGEERPGAAWARSSFRSGHGHFSFIRASEVNLEEFYRSYKAWNERILQPRRRTKEAAGMTAAACFFF